MKYTKKIQKAINFAAVGHQAQKRKDLNKTPYIVHPVGVAMILSQYTNDQNVIIAGLLHDVVEDCGISKETLKKEFGQKVASIVMEVTEDMALKSKKGAKASWTERKQGYLSRLKTDSKEALMVCAADKIHNLNSMREAFDVEGAKFWKSFNSPADQKLWFYEEIYKQLKNRIPGKMLGEYRRALEAVRRVV